jgi:hypothetical protein
VPSAATALALGHSPDTRWLYLLVYVAVAVGLGRSSLRARGGLLVPLFLLANPLFLPFLWPGETDVLLLAGLAGLAWALGRDRPVLAALAAAGAWVWCRSGVAGLLGAGAAASLAALYFSRAFNVTY